MVSFVFSSFARALYDSFDIRMVQDESESLVFRL